MKARIFFTGVGGQGTLTTTNLLGTIALDAGLPVVAGEIHGMAQRGGVVESSVSLGGFHSPKISLGEADILLGFEPLEAYRGLCYLKEGGIAVCNEERIPPPSVATGKQPYPDLDEIKQAVQKRAGRSLFLPCITLGSKAGAVQSGNIALLAALLTIADLPLTVDTLKAGIQKHLKPKLVDINLKALEMGAEMAASA